MTAEIAILNKSAVALAADSAVTISAGEREQKIFDSQDKLFELSNKDPIGIMIFNGMNFADVPLQILIKKFRGSCKSFSSIKESANSFLQYLNDFGRDSPKEVKISSVERIISPLFVRIHERIIQKIYDLIKEMEKDSAENKPFDKMRDEIVESVIPVYERIFSRMKPANFVGGGDIILDEEFISILNVLGEKLLIFCSHDQRQRIIEIAKYAISKDWISDQFTGIVIAGFGNNELFPTLISYHIDGIVCGRLKYIQTNHIDIDRKGPKAKVLPFAQKEMVERFLYGLDESIQKDITEFTRTAVSQIGEKVLSKLSFSDDDSKNIIGQDIKDAEEAFVSGLREEGFAAIRKQSEAEIEDMVEFMPKPELAKMAEALVNLTSIKRRVSRGMETVGGPIDVAVISASEGFVWVKRKHYFDSELNSRYFSRVQELRQNSRETRDVEHEPARRLGASRGKKAKSK